METGKLYSIILISALICILCFEKCFSQSGVRNNGRGQRRQGGGINRALLEAYREVYQRPPTTASPTTTMRNSAARIPPIPHPDDVECFVEITLIRRRGGVCGKFGGNQSSPYYCQRGAYTEIQHECEAIVLARTNPNPESVTVSGQD